MGLEDRQSWKDARTQYPLHAPQQYLEPSTEREPLKHPMAKMPATSSTAALLTHPAAAVHPQPQRSSAVRTIPLHMINLPRRI